MNGVKDETYEGESIYVEGVVTAVWDSENGSLTLYNVEGTEEPLVLNWSIIADLASRVQSMVNVPINKYGNPAMEFAIFVDNDWNTNWNPLGTTALPYEIRFKVYPAECAAAIAADPSVLSFDCVETKGEEVPTLEVVKATADASGMLNLTVIGHDFNPIKNADTWEMNEEFNKSYVYALVLDDGNNVRSSEYLPLEMNWYSYLAEVVVLNKQGKEVAPFSFESLEIPYTSNESVVALKDVTPALKVSIWGAEPSYVKAADLAAAGYDFDITMTALPLQSATPMAAKYFVQTIGEDGYASISLADGVKAENIGAFTTQAYAIYCEKYDASFQVMSNIAVGREKATVTAPEKTATWSYKSDAGVDANQGFYTREFSYSVDSFTAENLPADTEIADVLAMAGTCMVKDYPEAAAAVTVDGEMATLALSFPEWSEEPYEVVFTYALENVDVVFTFVVNTVGRSNESIEIELPASTVTYTKDLELAGDVVDSLDVLYNAIPYDLSEMTAAEWLKDVFATNAFTYETTIQPAEKDEEGEYVYAPIVDKNSGWTTGLKLVPGATNEIHTDFTYRTNFQTDGVIPTGLEYTMKVTTWYGQEFVITKALNFELPKYTFKHSEYYVYDSAEGYYSQVIGKFVGEPISGFSVNEINMLQAFYLYDDKGTLMDADALAAAGIDVKFSVEAESEGIVMANNKLTYNGADESVSVDAKIALVNSNGNTIEIPTNFAETYADYVVKKYDPIDALTVAEVPAVKVSESKEYTVDAFDYLVLTDVKANAILKGGNWNSVQYSVDPQTVYSITYEWGKVNIPAEMAAYVTFADGVVTFNNTGDLQLAKALEISVPVTFKYVWGERTATVKVTFLN